MWTFFPNTGVGDAEQTNVTRFLGGSTNQWQLWTKPAGKSLLHVFAWAGGGGAGGGAGKALAGGGGGGGPGAVFSGTFPLVMLPDVLFVQCGAGGIGGAGGLASGTGAASNGTAGGSTFLCTAPSFIAQHTLVNVSGGGQALGGGAGGGTGGNLGNVTAIAGARLIALALGFTSNQGTASTGGATIAASDIAPMPGICSGGAGGGGAGNFTGGGLTRVSGSLYYPTTLPDFKAAGGAAPGIGQAGLVTWQGFAMTGGFGGGGTNTSGVAGGRGGDGAPGCGGGGGGASNFGNADGGKGGDGGPGGMVLIAV